MKSRYKNYQQIYTDGSKEDSKVGCAVISDNHSNMQRIPDDQSISTAEVKAIDLAVDFISTCDANNKFIIFSDSLSVLKAINHTSSKNPQIQKLLEKCHELLAYKEIVLCWIPSHIGIQGNETVDKQAKTSLSLEPTFFKIPLSNFKPSINKYILESWHKTNYWWTSISCSKHKKRRSRFGSTPFRSYKSHTFILTTRWRATTMCWLRCTIHCTSLPFGVWRFCTSKKKLLPCW